MTSNVTIPVLTAETITTTAANAVADQIAAAARDAASSTVRHPATVKQTGFIRSLAAERSVTGLDLDTAGVLATVLANDDVERDAASKLIKTLLAAPHLTPTQQGTPDVPAGRYALPGLGADTRLRFYVVDRPDKGRWAGKTFVSVMASDERHPVRGNAATAVLARIAADPEQASLTYGREVGRCGRCGRTLTDADSRARGIGPDCASKGW